MQTAGQQQAATTAAAAGIMTALGADTNEDGGGESDQLQGSDECRICRSSVQELLEADSRPGIRSCFSCCQRGARRPPLRRLRCSCLGSVSHICARCYRRYYVARGLTACEICRQPIGLQDHDDDGEDGKEVAATLSSFCRRLASLTCSEDFRYLVYAAVILLAFISVFILFFVCSAAADDHGTAAAEAAAAKLSGASSRGAAAKTHTQQPHDRLERFVFLGVALLNLCFAVAYFAYSYWRHCRGGRGGCSSSSSSSRADDFLATGGGLAVPASAVATSHVAVQAITIAVPQQPQI